MTSLGTTSKPADMGSAMGPEIGLEVGRRPSGCPATRPRHARTLTGHGRHKFGRFHPWPGPASRSGPSIKLKNVLRRGSVRVDQNAPKVGMRPRVGILSSAPPRRAIASVHRGCKCRDFNGKKTPGGLVLRLGFNVVLQRILRVQTYVA